MLKIAKKRAYVDGILSATAASDIFTQDIEDFPEEMQGNVATQEKESSKPNVDMPKKKNTNEAPPQETEQAICSKCHKEITDKVFEYSIEKYGIELCFDCQNLEKKKWMV